MKIRMKMATQRATMMESVPLIVAKIMMMGITMA